MGTRSVPSPHPRGLARELSATERLDALAARGIMLYLASSGELRAKCEPCFSPFLDAALPAIRLHKAALVSELTGQREEAVTLILARADRRTASGGTTTRA